MQRLLRHVTACVSAPGLLAAYQYGTSYPSASLSSSFDVISDVISIVGSLFLLSVGMPAESLSQ